MSTKRAVNLSIDAELLAQAKLSGANLSRTLEDALRGKIREERHRRWRDENQTAIEASNDELERNGTWYRPEWLPE